MTKDERKLYIVSGPVKCHDDVLFAMSTPSIYHMSFEFASVFGETITMTRKLHLTETGQPFIVSGSSSLVYLICSYSLRIYGANITLLTINIGSYRSQDVIKEALTKTSYKSVAVTHVDTSTGVLFDIKSLSEMVKWNLDVVITGSQKGLGSSTGLSIIIVSQDALQTVQDQKKTLIRSYYSNWTKWLPVMQAYEANKEVYFATPAAQLIYALHASLIKIPSQSLEERFGKHKQSNYSI
ncbi:pyridoxal phosphate-dependent transferase [Cokeromyces recurvatus]|uniref:pyridoxal phosphate-dependent transferase n=1 Tax=Cokeromyces recurvatus TaxID=90255 RepID=UPI00221F91CC|nr:pyridoxal phosphate-dependent transferase [Cokeromyces recurvatus]KAI7904061.1 pyridoxal phosphate-dependent transferase [Cokeromyces recurvatus]